MTVPRDELVTGTMRVPAGHPSLPGHFPGRPVVPAVVILDQVLTVAEERLGAPACVRQLLHAKFVRPLLPDEDASVELRLGAGALRFSVTAGGKPVASGAFAVAGERLP